MLDDRVAQMTRHPDEQILVAMVCEARHSPPGMASPLPLESQYASRIGCNESRQTGWRRDVGEFGSAPASWTDDKEEHKQEPQERGRRG
jgi:hypothetical protein